MSEPNKLRERAEKFESKLIKKHGKIYFNFSAKDLMELAFKEQMRIDGKKVGDMRLLNMPEHNWDCCLRTRNRILTRAQEAIKNQDGAK